MSGAFNLRAAHARIVGPATRRNGGEQDSSRARQQTGHSGEGEEVAPLVDPAAPSHRTLGAKHPFPLGSPPVVTAARNNARYGYTRQLADAGAAQKTQQFRVSQSRDQTPAGDAGHYGQLTQGRQPGAQYSFADRQALSVYRPGPELEARMAEDERVWHCWLLSLVALVLFWLCAPLFY